MRWFKENGYSLEVKILLFRMFETIEKQYESSNYIRFSRKNKLDFINETFEILEECGPIEIITKSNDVIDIKRHRGATLFNDKSIFINGTKSEEIQISTLLHELEHRKQKGYKVLREYVASHLLSRALREGNASSAEMGNDDPDSRTEEIGFKDKSKLILPSLSGNGLNYLIYVKLCYILGEDFMAQWKNDSSYTEDFIERAKNRIINKYGRKKGSELGNQLFKSIAAVLINYEFLVDPQETNRFMVDYINCAKNTRDQRYYSGIEILEQEISYLNNLDQKQRNIWETIEYKKMQFADMQRARIQSKDRNRNLDNGLDVARLTQTQGILDSMIEIEKVFANFLNADISKAESLSDLKLIGEFIRYYNELIPVLYNSTKGTSEPIIPISKLTEIIEGKEQLIMQNRSQV